MFLLDQNFYCHNVQPDQMDALWAEGWRHFGTEFFRYSVAFHTGRIFTVVPLRIDLSRFSISRSQKRVLARNRDLSVVIRDSFIDRIKEDLFERHKQRFKSHVPDSLFDFLSPSPSDTPCRNREISVYTGERLIAVSFLDLGRTATSAVYAMFDPAESSRSLGIFTILEGIRYSRSLDCRYYYPGYAYREPSIYDYKKNFLGLEYYDWESGWKSFSRPLHKIERGSLWDSDDVKIQTTGDH